MKKRVIEQKVENTSKAYHFANIQELIRITNNELEDVLYIGKKTHGHNYRSDFTFKTKKEIASFKNNEKPILDTQQDAGFFVYNERTGEIVPFKEDDYLLYDRGYVAFDGKKYLSYDDNGNEVGNFLVSKN